MNDTLLVFCSFMAGALVGFMDFAPDLLLKNDLALPTLWLFMGIIGISLGRDKQLMTLLHTLNPHILLLPAATTLGTFIGSALCSLFIAYNLYECLAIGAGFAYYSLSSIFITRELGADLGAAALLANVFREILTIILAGFIYKRFGADGIISCGGAASMDTILGIVIRTGGREWAVPALAHGILMDFSVPFWLAIFCPLAASLN